MHISFFFKKKSFLKYTDLQFVSYGFALKIFSFSVKNLYLSEYFWKELPMLPQVWARIYIAAGGSDATDKIQPRISFY